MRPSKTLAIQADIARRLAEAEAMLDAQDQVVLGKAQATPVVGSQAPAVEAVPPVEGSSALLELYTVRHSGPRWKAGKRRKWAYFFEPLSDIMADGTTLREGAAKLGLSFSERDIKRLYELREFRQLRLAKRRLFNSSAWGQPNSKEVLAKLLVLEDRKKPRRMPKPRKPLI